MGDLNAMVNLGFMYHDGKGVEEDDKKALKWFKKAAEEDSAEAMHWVGHTYENGYGVDKDEKEARDWYKMATDKGHDGAQKAVERLEGDK